MVTATGALLAIVGYAIAVGCAGLYFANRERRHARLSANSSGEEVISAGKPVHGVLRMDTGDELEVHLRKRQ